MDNFYKSLLEYNTDYAEEDFVKNKMLEFLKTVGNLSFYRDSLSGHFTASSFLINKDKTSVCFGHHKKLNKWLFLGGHFDGDNDPLFVSIKEAKEESGIKSISPVSNHIFDIGMYLIPSYKNVPAHYHFDVTFILQAHSDEFKINNEEMNDLKWVSIESPKSHWKDMFKDESICRMIEKYKKLQAKE